MPLLRWPRSTRPERPDSPETMSEAGGPFGVPRVRSPSMYGRRPLPTPPTRRKPAPTARGPTPAPLNQIPAPAQAPPSLEVTPSHSGFLLNNFVGGFKRLVRPRASHPETPMESPDGGSSYVDVGPQTQQMQQMQQVYGHPPTAYGPPPHPGDIPIHIVPASQDDLGRDPPSLLLPPHGPDGSGSDHDPSVMRSPSSGVPGSSVVSSIPPRPRSRASSRSQAAYTPGPHMHESVPPSRASSVSRFPRATYPPSEAMRGQEDDEDDIEDGATAIVQTEVMTDIVPTRFIEGPNPSMRQQTIDDLESGMKHPLESTTTMAAPPRSQYGSTFGAIIRAIKHVRSLPWTTQIIAADYIPRRVEVGPPSLSDSWYTIGGLYPGAPPGANMYPSGTYINPNVGVGGIVQPVTTTVSLSPGVSQQHIISPVSMGLSTNGIPLAMHMPQMQAPAYTPDPRAPPPQVYVYDAERGGYVPGQSYYGFPVPPHSNNINDPPRQVVPANIPPQPNGTASSFGYGPSYGHLPSTHDLGAPSMYGGAPSTYGAPSMQGHGAQSFYGAAPSTHGHAPSTHGHVPPVPGIHAHDMPGAYGQAL